MVRNIIILSFILFPLRAVTQEQYDSVPIKFVEDYIFIELNINDKEEPLHFLFDTGAGVTVVDTKVAEELSLNFDSETRISTSGKSLLSKESSSNKIRIGKRSVLENISLIAMDLGHLSKYLKTNVDGVIGFDLLNTFVTETNIDKKKIIFYEPENYKYKGQGQALKLTTLESNLFGIMINITSSRSNPAVELNFKIDTAADNYLTFHNSTVTELGLIDNSKKQKFKKGFGADSTVTTNIKSKIKNVSFAGKKWKNVPVILQVDSINKRSNTLANGLIGQRLLLDFNIIYNLSSRTGYFEKRN